MAEMKSKGEKRYGSKPHVGKPPEKGDTDKSGHSEESSKMAKKSAGTEEAQANMDSDPGPEASVAAGTDGINVTHERHAGEREEMMKRHDTERGQMNRRHEKDMGSMAKRHMDELSMPSGDMSEGESGTEEE